MSEHSELSSIVAALGEAVQSLKGAVSELKDEFKQFREDMKEDRKNYVTQTEFAPIKSSFDAGTKYLARMFVLLVLGVIVLLGVVFKGNLPL